VGHTLQFPVRCRSTTSKRECDHRLLQNRRTDGDVCSSANGNRHAKPDTDGKLDTYSYCHGYCDSHSDSYRYFHSNGHSYSNGDAYLHTDRYGNGYVYAYSYSYSDSYHDSDSYRQRYINTDAHRNRDSHSNLNTNCDPNAAGYTDTTIQPTSTSAPHSSATSVMSASRETKTDCSL
jgi:hypothetical protein